jgi:superfamily II DNA or RNA helicase
MSAALGFQPGSIVSARGREWIVLPPSAENILRLRPLGGNEQDTTLVYLPLEPQPLVSAQFPLPDPTTASTAAAAQLLCDALLLKLRHGAGPFRSLGNIAFEPRAYQLVPLLMALKLDTIRLLIADDVGIGKTIEAGLIVRELLDRGEIQRLTVLCPPHLCEQWQDELQQRFHLPSVVVRSSTAGRLEQGLPPGQSIFENYPHTIVSLDYIKSDRRRDEFYRSCPECVIVDEAHTCTQRGARHRQQRFLLLKGLAERSERHLILLTATPHSGDEEAFFNLLGLLRPEFVRLKALPPDERQPLRQQLALHFAQRRRPDIAEWQDSSVFPERFTAELTYRLSGDWGRLFQAVLEYARELVTSGESQGELRRRINGWAALALLRCISSSPAAAVSALRTRLKGLQTGTEAEQLAELAALAQERIFDGAEDGLSAEDIEPAAQTEDSIRLEALLQQANALAGPAHDPKLKILIEHLKRLLTEGFQPVIFCRYLATAHYVAEQLQRTFKDYAVSTVTGELTPREREQQVLALRDRERRILVATDCLSEGINLQELLNAVVHYDLSWNPTRHEQREGRVDRFGQLAREVRCTLLYGEDNPVDGAVLQVILRKAEAIRKELGVLVPLPDDDNRFTEALMRAVLLRQGTLGTQQIALDFSTVEQELSVTWENARAKAAKNRSLFAQRRMHPDEVLPEWRKTLAVLGGEAEVERFVKRAASQCNAPLQPERGHYRFALDYLPPAVCERLAAEGLSGTLMIAFHYPSPPEALFIHRTHPLVSALADFILETALDDVAPELVARGGAIFTAAVTRRTALYLLRLRSQLSITRPGRDWVLLCEEALAVSQSGSEPPRLLSPDERQALFDAVPARNMPPPVRNRHLQLALDQVPALQPFFAELAQQRADELLADHRRVREASQATGSYQVKPVLPVDVIGLYVLVPIQT